MPYLLKGAIILAANLRTLRRGLPSASFTAMTQNSRDLLIGWSLLPFLSPNRVRLLLEHFDPLDDVLRAPARLLQGLLNIDGDQAASILRAQRDKRVKALRASTITMIDDDYPQLLREIIDPPLALHFRGNREFLKRDAVAVVGSRRATPYGINAAKAIAGPLAGDAKLVVVSGLARGVDGAAHEAALDANGATVAVLGTGIDVVYPRSHLRLFRRIESDGLIVTELPPGSPPLAANFPSRNRIISGLSLGTVIVEATGRSGSLITARTAAEQGREVFAIPGSIFSVGSEGTHRLIQYGAKLVHDVNDILEELPEHARIAMSKPQVPDSPLREVLEALSKEEATHVETAAQKLKQSLPQISETLLQLELGGWVKALPGARYVRVK
jgi:DNA processing protein